MDEYLLGVVAAFTGAILFAVTNIMYKKLSDRVSIVDIILTRAWISIPLAILLILPPFNPEGFVITQSGVIVLTFSMFVGMILGDTFYFMSQNRIGVSRAYPIASSYPLLVYLLAAMFLGEPVILSRVVGVILVVIGVGLIGFEQKRNDPKGDIGSKSVRMLGFILALLTIVTWSLSDVTLQVGLVDMDAIDANFVRILVGSLMITPGIIYRKETREWTRNRRLLTTLLITGFLGYGLTMLLMTIAVSYIGATVNSVILAAAPLISTPVSILFTDETTNMLLVIGTLLSFVGVVLVVFAPQLDCTGLI